VRGRSVKRLLVALVVAAAGGFVVMHPGAVKAFYEDIYPSDPAKRQALELCFMRDPNFNRLNPGQREACYRQARLPVGILANENQQPNPLDLERAASMGPVPHNDIRRQQDEQKALHK
jgi:hypothetical protein